MQRFLLAFVLLMPLVAEAAGAPRDLRELSNEIVSFVGALTFTLTLTAFVVYLYGIAYDYVKLNQGETGDMKQYYFWGIAILFVMASIWGILRLLQTTVFNGEVPGSNGGSELQDCATFTDCNPIIHT